MHTKSAALSKHPLIQAKAGEKDLDSADNKRKTSAGTDIRREIPAEVLTLHPCRVEHAMQVRRFLSLWH